MTKRKKKELKEFRGITKVIKVAYIEGGEFQVLKTPVLNGVPGSLALEAPANQSQIFLD